METIFAILPAILTPLAISAVLSWIYGQSKREEAEDRFVSRTKYPRRFTVCAVVALAVTVLLFVAGTVLICVLEKDFPAHAWAAFILSALFVVAIPFSLVLLAFRTYEIIREDGILVRRVFKSRFVLYSEMASYRYSLGQLTVYDSDCKILFGVYDNRVGMKALLDRLEQNVIPAA